MASVSEELLWSSVAELLVGSVAEQELAGISLLEDVAELEELAGTLPPVTVIVPFLLAFVFAPVVVTVNLYALASAVLATVPEM